MIRFRTKLFFVLTLLLQFAIAAILSGLPSASNILAIQTTFSAQTFNEIVSGWSQAQLNQVLSHYYFDFLYPVCYSSLFYFLLEDLQVKNHFKYWAVAAGFCDWIENIFHILLFNNIIDRTNTNVFTAATFASIKWFSVFLLSALILANLWQRFKKRS